MSKRRKRMDIPDLEVQTQNVGTTNQAKPKQRAKKRTTANKKKFSLGKVLGR